MRVGGDCAKAGVFVSASGEARYFVEVLGGRSETPAQRIRPGSSRDVRLKALTRAAIGETNKEIGEGLRVSTRHIEGVMSSLHHTLGVVGRSGLLYGMHKAGRMSIVQTISPDRLLSVEGQQRRLLMLYGQGRTIDAARAELGKNPGDQAPEVAAALGMPHDKELLGAVAVLAGWMDDIAVPPEPPRDPTHLAVEVGAYLRSNPHPHILIDG